MKKRIKYSYYFIMSLVAITIAASMYVIFTPFQVLSYPPYSEFEVNYDKASNSISGNIDFCKFEPIPTDVERQVIGYTSEGVKYKQSFFNIVDTPIGCYKDFTLNIELPDLPKGTYYIVNYIEYTRLFYSIRFTRQTNLFTVE